MAGCQKSISSTSWPPIVNNCICLSQNEENVWGHDLPMVIYFVLGSWYWNCPVINAVTMVSWSVYIFASESRVRVQSPSSISELIFRARNLNLDSDSQLGISTRNFNSESLLGIPTRNLNSEIQLGISTRSLNSESELGVYQVIMSSFFFHMSITARTRLIVQATSGEWRRV